MSVGGGRARGRPRAVAADGFESDGFESDGPGPVAARFTVTMPGEMSATVPRLSRGPEMAGGSGATPGTCLY